MAVVWIAERVGTTDDLAAFVRPVEYLNIEMKMFKRLKNIWYLTKKLLCKQ